jgi:hypothetical protein
MSELIHNNDNRTAIRWKLLTGASALVLAAHTASVTQARAEDTDRPTVWIELGGQFNTVDAAVEPFAPPFSANRPSNLDPSQKFEKLARRGFGESGAITLQPEGSNWVFSASVQYGRLSTNNYNLQQTNPERGNKYNPGVPGLGLPLAQRFAQTTAKTSEQHLVLDFAAGKDVGLGLFGKHGTSVVSAGVRFAQFSGQSNIAIKSDPDWQFYYTSLAGYRIVGGQKFHDNAATLIAERSFHGVGPSLSWKASAPLAGNPDDGEIVADWGLNGAVLFGRQRAKTHHQSTVRYFKKTQFAPLSYFAVPQTVSGYPVAHHDTRSRSVVAPNIGAFAGLSFKYPNAKISVGYRADFFFGPMDGGIDGRKTSDRNFYGPFATISFGFGG